MTKTVRGPPLTYPLASKLAQTPGSSASTSAPTASKSKPGNTPLLTAIGLQTSDYNLIPNIFLGFDDGSLLHLEVTLEPAVRLTLLDRRRPVSSITVASGTMLILTGEMCDGEVVSVDPTTNTVTPLSIIPNWAPIIDCKIGREKNQFITCSGFGVGGSVRNMSNQLSVDIVTTTNPDYEGTTGMWSLRANTMDPYHSFLCVSFVASTRLLYSAEGELEDISASSGLVLTSTTLVVGVSSEGFVLQVCPHVINITRPKTPKDARMELDEVPAAYSWTPPQGTQITIAKIADDLIVAALSKGRQLLLLRVTHADSGEPAVRIEEIGSCEMAADPCSLDISRWSKADTTRFHVYLPSWHVFVGTHQGKVHVLPLDQASFSGHREAHVLDLRPVSRKEDSRAEAVALFRTRQVAYLLVGLRDGFVLSLPLGLEGFDETKARTEQLGVHPVQLIHVDPQQSAESEPYILALADKPWKIHASAVGLVFSPICFDKVAHGAPFAFEGLDGLMFVSNNALSLVNMETSAKAMHVDHLHLGEVASSSLFFTDSPIHFARSLPRPQRDWCSTTP